MCRFNLFLPAAFPDEDYHGLYFSFKAIKKNEFGTFLDNIYAYDVCTENCFRSFGKGDYVHQDWEALYSDLAEQYPEAYERLVRERYDQEGYERWDVDEWLNLFRELIWVQEYEWVGILYFHEGASIRMYTCDTGTFHIPEERYFDYDEYDQPLNSIQVTNIRDLDISHFYNLPVHELLYVTKD